MNIWIRILPAVIWMIVIFITSHQPGEVIDEGMLVWIQAVFPYVRDLNFGHFIAYFILALTVYLALGARWLNWKGRLITIALCVLYGITDEFHQSFIPGRYPDIADLRNDLIGAALAMLLVALPPVHKVYKRLAEGKKY